MTNEIAKLTEELATFNQTRKAEMDALKVEFGGPKQDRTYTYRKTSRLNSLAGAL